MRRVNLLLRAKGCIGSVFLCCVIVLLFTYPAYGQRSRRGYGRRSAYSAFSAADRYRHMDLRQREALNNDMAASRIDRGGYNRSGNFGRRSGALNQALQRRDINERKYNYSRRFQQGNSTVLSNMYEDTFTGSYRNWYQPEVAIRANRHNLSNSAHSDNGGITGDDKKTMPLEQLVKNYILGHRQGYLNQGWGHFKRGDYRRACDAFKLADAVSYDSLQARSLVKVALMQSAIASRQYMLATNSLTWLIKPDPHTKELRNPHFLKEVAKVRSRYGDEDDFDNHVSELITMARGHSNSPEITALRAVVLWSIGDRTRRTEALVCALDVSRLVRTVDDPRYEIWAQLHTLMDEAHKAERLTGFGEKPTSQPSAFLVLPSPGPLDLTFGTSED